MTPVAVLAGGRPCSLASSMKMAAPAAPPRGTTVLMKSDENITGSMCRVVVLTPTAAYPI